jgi:hypothetical protein
MIVVPPDKAKVLPGDTCFRWKVLGRAFYARLNGRGDRLVYVVCECQCPCRTVAVLLAANLVPRSMSCGCLQKQRAAVALRKTTRKHGESRTNLYLHWRVMKQRCYNAKCDAYPAYGGRGIEVCVRWRHSFPVFRSWARANGYRDGLELDRVDVNDNYRPGNCRWVEPNIQARNRRSNVLLTAFGETKTAIEWTEDTRCVVNHNTLLLRIKAGSWGAEEALTTPNQRGPRPGMSRWDRMRKRADQQTLFDEV